MEGDLVKEVIQKRLFELRDEHGWTQAKLASEAKITAAAICQIEKGERIPTAPVLHRIAKVLGVSMDYLLGRNDESKFEDLLQDNDVQEFYRGYKKLSLTDKETIQKHIEFLNSQKTS